MFVNDAQDRCVFAQAPGDAVLHGADRLSLGREIGVRLQELTDLRLLYEPYVQATARRLFITLPPMTHLDKKKDNWQSGPWDRALQARSLAERVRSIEEHF